MHPERFLDDGSEVGHPFDRLLLQRRVLRRKLAQNFAVQFLLDLGVPGKPGFESIQMRDGLLY